MRRESSLKCFLIFFFPINKSHQNVWDPVTTRLLELKDTFYFFPFCNLISLESQLVLLVNVSAPPSSIFIYSSCHSFMHYNGLTEGILGTWHLNSHQKGLWKVFGLTSSDDCLSLALVGINIKRQVCNVQKEIHSTRYHHASYVRRFIKQITSRKLFRPV